MKEKQVEHQKHIIEVQEKLKTNLSEVSMPCSVLLVV